MTRAAAVLVALVLTIFAGCGSADDGAAVAVGSGQTPATAADGRGPDRVVYDFLEAIRVGDAEKAGQMLTDTARTRTAEHELDIAPPGSDTASFAVGNVQHPADGIAWVACRWSDLGPDGQRETDDIVWVLRREAIGWRIGGMVLELFAGEPPLILDFENPEDMLRKQQLAAEEMARRAQDQAIADIDPSLPDAGRPATRQAVVPTGGGDPR